VWGTAMGGTLTTFAACVSAALGFLIARYVAEEQTSNFLSRRNWLWILENIRKLDWQLILLARINPIVPFGVTNYLFGLTSVSFLRYMVATGLSNLPLSFFFAAVGDALFEVAMEGDVRKAVIQVGIGLLAVSGFVLAKKILTPPQSNR